MKAIRDLADELAHTHNTDELGQVPIQDAYRIKAEFLTPTMHDFSDLFVLHDDEEKAFKYLRAVVSAFGELSRQDVATQTTAQRIAAGKAWEEGCKEFAIHFAMLAGSLVHSEAEQALRDAYDALNPESDGIQAEDNALRAADMRAAQ